MKMAMMEFSVPIRDECTALTLVAKRYSHNTDGGNEKDCTEDKNYSIIAGFTDGSIRLLDPFNEQKPITLGHIHGKGVHRALRMDLAVSEDGCWCFASALRGSMELMAIRLRHIRLEGNALDDTDLEEYRTYSHCDAKLRGLGACTKLTDEKYLLLTGKSIKNIHIWSFVPPSPGKHSEPSWQCLYDCPTNGNTIQWLHFRRDPFSPQSQLQAISKSQGQKLRVWDISYECNSIATGSDDGAKEEDSSSSNPSHSRPTRPPFVDVAHTEGALGIAGDWAVCGGETFHNQISIVALDPHLFDDPYNHTELALPQASTHSTSNSNTNALSTAAAPRRAQRGDLKSVVAVTGLPHLLVLELSDGTVAEYALNSHSSGALSLLPGLQAPLGAARQMALCPVPSQETKKVLLLVATHHQGRGSIVGLYRPPNAAAAAATTHIPKRRLLEAEEMSTVTDASSASNDEAFVPHGEDVTSVPRENDNAVPVPKPSANGSISNVPASKTSNATSKLLESKPVKPKLKVNNEKKRKSDVTATPLDLVQEKKKKKKKKRIVDPLSLSTPHSTKTIPVTTPFLHKPTERDFQTNPTPVAAPRVTPDAAMPPEHRNMDGDLGSSPDPSPPVPRKRGSLPLEITTPQLLRASRSATPRSSGTAQQRAVDLRDACTKAMQQLQRLEEQETVTTNLQRNTAKCHPRVIQMRRHHFAAHLRMRQRVLQATRSTIESLGESPQLAHLDPAHGYLAAALSNYQAITNKMVQLQSVESYTLKAMQPLPDGETAEVSFSFPDIFEQAMACFPKLES